MWAETTQSPGIVSLVDSAFGNCFKGVENGPNLGQEPVCHGSASSGDRARPGRRKAVLAAAGLDRRIGIGQYSTSTADERVNSRAA